MHCSHLQSVPATLPQLLLYADKLVIFGNPLGTAQRACLYLTGIYGNGKVCYKGIFCISATVRYDAGVIVPLCQCNSFQGLS